ncbi:MAG: family 10 glycosylhydrolase [Ignavibacteriales bacterium]|nr:family 10 glycosylhydrolase [Ignavibacteriales bacterium]
MSKKIPALIRSLLLTGLLSLFAVQTSNAQPTYNKREMRGVWIATVANIDYPSSRKLGTEEKITELKNMLVNLKDAGINTIFFQVRTECDALYQSSIEPWSYWLTGKQGQAPDPFFDPLQVAVEESHKLGMELHAWFNPYRAVKNPGEYTPAQNHVAVQHPDWILSFKDYQMLNPGMPQVEDFIVSVMDDVMGRYDIDGIHFDDYFYPYGPKVQFEDTATYKAYPRGISNIDDWRRDNINKLMARLYKSIQSKKPYIKFGISPFGIVENKYTGTNGFESYKILYCDPLNWIENKIVDYVLPQLYWDMNHEKAPFAKLLPWWAKVTKPALLTIGLYSSNFLGDKFKGSPSELQNQMRMIRSTDNVFGEVFFSAKSISKNRAGFADSLRYNFYLYPALPPAMPWKITGVPAAPEKCTVNYKDGKITINWSKSVSSLTGNYVIYRFESADSLNINDPRAIRAVIPKEQLSYSDYMAFPRDVTYAVTTLSREGSESIPLFVKLQFKSN